MTTTDELAALARRHLAEADAATWTALLRPGVRLVHLEGVGAPVAARLGGDPQLPLDAEWPRWEGHGPLGFIASVDCGAVAETGPLDIAWPKDGTLLFFLYNQGDAFADIAARDSQDGARVIYVPADAEAAERETPEDVEAYPQIFLRAVPTATEPGGYHRAVRDAFPVDADESRRFARRSVNHRRFVEALETALDVPTIRHQVGGWAIPVQGDVESEVAIFALGDEVTPKRITEEETRWVLLAQFDTDEAAMLILGDAGTAYWMIRREDLAAGRFDRALFTLQSC